MVDIVPADLMRGGRVVARFRTDPSEVWATATAMTPALHFGTPWGKRGLFAISFAVGAFLAFGRDWLPGWPWWLWWVLPAFIAGMLASTMLWMLMGKRSRRQMSVLAREGETRDVAVTCHPGGFSWATDEIVHYLSYTGVDQATEQNGMVMVRYKLFILYVPPRGFASPEDKAYFVDSLRRNVPAERLTGLA